MKRKVLALLLALCLGVSSLTGCSCNKSEEVETTEQHGYTVYITNTGSKYHSKGCQYLRQSCIPIGNIDAEEQGYSPCSRCNP